MQKLAPHSADRATDPVPMDGAVGAAFDLADPVELLATFQALGVPWGEAVGQVASTLGLDAAKILLGAKTHGLDHGGMYCAVLAGIADGYPDVANALLREGLSSGRIQEWGGSDLPHGFYFSMSPWVDPLPDGLHVKGVLDLTANERMRALPAGLQVDGSLVLQDCRAMAALPDGLRVERNMCLDNCFSLRALPAGLKVGGSLWLRNCSALEFMPTDIEVGCDLNLHGCSALKSLPEGLCVNHIIVSRCDSWDGKIPMGACGQVTTDQEFQVSIDRWREKYPNGYRGGKA